MAKKMEKRRYETHSMENAVTVQILQAQNHLDEDRPDRVFRKEGPALLVLRNHHRHVRLVRKVSNLPRQ